MSGGLVRAVGNLETIGDWHRVARGGNIGVPGSAIQWASVVWAAPGVWKTGGDLKHFGGSGDFTEGLRHLGTSGASWREAWK